MSPTPEELQVGAKAYQSVCFYEKYAARNLWPTIWILAGCNLFLILLAFLLKSHDLFLALFILLSLYPMGWVHSMGVAKRSYASQKMVLQLLEEKYGDTLPWIIEENVLDRSRQLEAEIAQASQ